MKPIVFLDIDGVLNAHEPLDPEVMCGRIHPDKVARLNRVLRETDARIVLSSAWRYLVHRGEMDLTGMGWLLRSHGVMANRLAGITMKDTMHDGYWDGKAGTWPTPNERGTQIADWLACNPAYDGASYVAIDDLDLGISEAGHPFVQTDGKVGLTDADADRAINLLAVRRSLSAATLLS